mmetsp:Transcript_30765/g.75682  ORF Transcript_30765/g.75682 Transcript_30765/m.75682 type:complete len:254 (-) Transcript_30765:308-1069(-)
MSPQPRYQLIKGDRYNLAVGVLAAFALAITKDLKALPAFARWQLNAYTNWNLTFIALRVLLQQDQWDPFLAVNSMGVFFGFRTAMTQRLDDNMRKKIARYGLPLPRPAFVAADHFVHTLPTLLLVGSLVRQKRRVPQMNALFSLVLSTWFAFRQGAKLDSSEIYVPHPWRRTWLAIATSLLATPALVDALIDNKRRRGLLIFLGMLLPYLSTRLDPKLRDTYNFEYAVATARGNSGATDADEKKIPRSESSFI